MSNKEERVWRYLVQHRNADYADVAEACGVDIAFVKGLVGRIGSDNWREETTAWSRAKVLDTAKEYVTKIVPQITVQWKITFRLSQPTGTRTLVSTLLNRRTWQ